MTDDVLNSFPTFDVDHPTGWLALCSRANR
jgi:hypothetical protein